MLMSEEAYAVPGLRAGLGRLANSVVAVLGPELSPGTDVYSKCKALIREIQVAIHAGCRSQTPEDFSRNHTSQANEKAVSGQLMPYTTALSRHKHSGVLVAARQSF